MFAPVIGSGSVAVTGIPPAALANGLTVKTFGPPFVYAAVGDSVAGQNLALFTFFGFNSGPPPTPPIQQGDGTILLRGHDSANGGAATAWVNLAKKNNWGGHAFGGPLYVEFVAKWTPFSGAITGVPALWLMPIEHLSSVVAWTNWNGQGTTQHWPEFDGMEYNAGTLTGYGSAYHDWWNDGTTHNVSAGVALTGNAAFSLANKFGQLNIPATPSSPGLLNWYMNDVLMRSYSYTQFVNNAGFTPPPIAGSTAMSVADSQHWVPIIGNGNSDGHVSDMTVSAISVWQSSSSNNLTQ
jgi:hypothetical protein